MRRSVYVVLVAMLLGGCSDQPSQAPTGSGVDSATGAPGTLPAPDTTGTPGGPGGPDPEPLPPSSADLIDAAVAAGTIDEATGLLYRIYATFGDVRLPGDYATGLAEEDVAAVMEAGAQIESLPADVAARIRPYLLRPTDPASPFNPVQAAAAGARTIAYHPPAGGWPTTAATCDPRLGWAYADGANWLRVWAPCGSPDEAAIPQVIAVADAMYDAEKQYLGGQIPPEDEGGVNQGWETRVDIYLTSTCVPRSAAGGAVETADDESCLGVDDGLTVASTPFIGAAGAKATSSFLLINPGVVADASRLRATVAHELFHAFENSYNHTGFFGSNGAKWIMEASATWAEWRFAGEIPTSRAGPIFAAFQGSKVSLQNNGVTNGYLSFGWPLFIEQQSPGNVRAVWEAIKGKTTGDAIIEAINGVVGFNDNFRIFAMRGWNREISIGNPVTPWLDAPPVSAGGARIQPFGPKSPRTIELVGTDKGATPVSLSGDSPSLWAHYQHFRVKADVGQVILDFSRVNPASRLDVDALVKLKGRQQWERRELPDGKTTWCIDNPDEAVEEFLVVLSNHAYHLTEKIGGDWTYDSPKEPCLSYHIHIEWTDVWNDVPDKVTFDGYADTINPDALGGQVMLTGTGTYEGDRGGYLACNPGLSGIPGHDRGDAVFQAVIDGDRVTVNAYADIFTNYAGVQTYPFEAPRKGTYDAATGADKPVQVLGADIGGDVCSHGYYGDASITIQVKPPP